MSTLQDQGAAQTGTKKGMKQEDIFAAELKKLQEDKNRMKEESLSYLQKHPEVRSLMDELLSSILLNRPSDVIKFASQFFKDKHNPENAGNMCR